MDFDLSEELKMVQSLARDFVKEQLKPLERDILGKAAGLIDARTYLPPETEEKLVKMAKDMGLWGIGIPEEFGGIGLGTLASCLVEEELAQTIIPFDFGDVTPILFDCNAEQKKQYLLPVLDRQKQSYLAITEPDKTEISTMETKAEKAGDDYILNGKKVSFSRPAKDYFAVVFACTGNGEACFLVDKDTKGFSVANGKEKIGWKAGLREPMLLVFEKCRVPKANILGEEGKAFSLGKKWLPARRIVRSARNVGVAQRLLEESAAQANSWMAFGHPISERTSVQAALSDIATQIHACRLMVYEAAWKADKGLPIRSESAKVKLFATRLIYDVADRVAHIFGSPPHISGLPMERLCQHVLATSNTELALELQRNIIAKDILKGLKV